MSETVIVDDQLSTVVVDEEPTSLTVVSDEVTIVSAAEQGPPGPQGTSGDKTFRQDFSVVASVSVPHNLGKYPAVTVINSAGDEVIGDVEYVDLDNVTVSFGAAFSGSVLCN